jgi:uncharacterized protein
VRRRHDRPYAVLIGALVADPARCPSTRVDVALVVGGRWHDMDYARSELLALLGAHDAVRCSVHDDFTDVDTLAAADAVVAYTCDVRATGESAEALRSMVCAGGRLLGLHGTNSAIDPPRGDGDVFRAPDAMPAFTSLVGSRFLAHPPIGPMLVEVVDHAHPLVAGIDDFVTTDEFYVSELGADLEVILDVGFQGDCRGFETDRVEEPTRLPVLYTRREGDGGVTYLTLGHCRGRFDIADLGVPDLGVVDHVAWDSKDYRRILARAISWAVHADEWPRCPVTEQEAA